MTIVTILWLFATIIYRWVLMILPSIGESYGSLFGLFTMFGWFYYIVSIIILGISAVKAWTIFLLLKIPKKKSPADAGKHQQDSFYNL